MIADDENYIKDDVKEDNHKIQRHIFEKCLKTNEKEVARGCYESSPV